MDDKLMNDLVTNPSDAAVKAAVEWWVEHNEDAEDVENRGDSPPELWYGKSMEGVLRAALPYLVENLVAGLLAAATDRADQAERILDEGNVP